MKQLIREIMSALADGESVATATVLASKGSTPRTAGAKMALRADGRLAGTVGGGLVEAQAVEAARQTLADRVARVLAFDLTGKLAADVDLICGGTMELLVDVVSAADGEVFSAAWAALGAGTRCHLVTAWREEGGRALELTRRVVRADGTWVGGAPLLAPEQLHDATRARRSAQVVAGPTGRRVLCEPLFPGGTVLIYGAGHVALPVAELCARVGFTVQVFDDRAEFATVERFPTAQQVEVLDSFEGAFAGRELGPESYVVIVTRGHRHDRAVLEQALRSDAGYIGMIGSRRKRDALYEALRAEGVSQQQLARVHCPIGLPIEAETPEEIAVSIVAELVAWRAAQARTA